MAVGTSGEAGEGDEVGSWGLGGEIEGKVCEGVGSGEVSHLSGACSLQRGDG